MRFPSSANSVSTPAPPGRCRDGPGDGLRGPGTSHTCRAFQRVTCFSRGGGSSTLGTPGLRAGEEGAQSRWGRDRGTQAPGERPGGHCPPERDVRRPDAPPARRPEPARGSPRSVNERSVQHEFLTKPMPDAPT